MSNDGSSNDRYWIVACDKPGLLVAMMRALAGNARISFEGDLSRCCFPVDLLPTERETDALRRNTIFPKQDFVVVPLEATTVGPILDVIIPKRRYVDDIIHIQIEQNGVLQFGAYDNFHPECIVCFSAIATALLVELQDSGVIRSWTRAHDRSA